MLLIPSKETAAAINIQRLKKPLLLLLSTNRAMKNLLSISTDKGKKELLQLSIDRGLNKLLLVTTDRGLRSCCCCCEQITLKEASAFANRLIPEVAAFAPVNR